MKKIFFILLIILVIYNFIFALPIPKKFNFQGRVTDNNNIPYNGNYNLTFRIYDSQTGGNLLWNETQNNILIQKDLYSVLLGSVNELNILFDKAYYLTIEINSEGEISPRVPIVPVGYSFRALYSDTAVNAMTLNNFSSDSFVKVTGDTITGNLKIIGTVNATYLKGDASQLTNISADTIDWSKVINKPTSFTPSVATDTAEWLKVNNRPTAISYFSNDSGFVQSSVFSSQLSTKADTVHTH